MLIKCIYGLGVGISTVNFLEVSTVLAPSIHTHPMTPMGKFETIIIFICPKFLKSL